MTTAAIDRAIRAASRPRPRAQAMMRAERKIVYAEHPVMVRRSGDFAIVRGREAEPAEGRLLVYDDRIRAYRPVLLPPGSRWELVEAGPRERRSIWLPPGKGPAARR